ncbi:MAG: type II toxin-antitoxin system VapC family toxin [Patescibacteria group bacterium]
MAESTNFFVLDASAILTVLLPDEKNTSKAKKLAIAIATKENIFLAPFLLEYEVINSLKSAVLQRRVTLSAAKKLLITFYRIPIHFKSINFLGKEILRDAIRYKLSAYDATYLWLAKKQKAKLVTFDKKLAGLAV